MIWFILWCIFGSLISAAATTFAAVKDRMTRAEVLKWILFAIFFCPLWPVVTGLMLIHGLENTEWGNKRFFEDE